MIVNYQAVKSRPALISHDGSHASLIKDLQGQWKIMWSTNLFKFYVEKKWLFVTSQDFIMTMFIFATVNSSSESAIALNQSAICKVMRKMEVANWLYTGFNRRISQILQLKRFWSIQESLPLSDSLSRSFCDDGCWNVRWSALSQAILEFVFASYVKMNACWFQMNPWIDLQS